MCTLLVPARDREQIGAHAIERGEYEPARLAMGSIEQLLQHREHRFVGLLASGAYRQSVLSIPTVGDRARAVLSLVDAGAETHTGRSIRNTLETLPRDLVFELDADRLAHLVIDIVGLQERQLVRIFDVAEPVGAWSTVLVYLPRTRFTARLPEFVAEAVAASAESVAQAIAGEERSRKVA